MVSKGEIAFLVKRLPSGTFCNQPQATVTF